MVIDDTGSVEDIHAFIYCKKWRFGQVSPMPDRQTDSQTKDSATQLLIKYKSGALVTQFSGLQELEVRICVQPDFPIIILILLTDFHKFSKPRGPNISAPRKLLVKRTVFENKC